MFLSINIKLMFETFSWIDPDICKTEKKQINSNTKCDDHVLKTFVN